MPDYLNNPTFNDEIIHLDGSVPNINFQYKWDTDNASWVPHTGDSVSVGDVTIGDIDLSDEQTHTLLQTLIDSVDGLEGSLDGVEGSLTNIEGSLDGVEGSLTNIEGSLDGVEGSLTNLETLSSDNKTYLEAIKTATESFQSSNNTDLTTLIGLGQDQKAFLALIDASNSSALSELVDVNTSIEALLTSAQNQETLTAQSNTLLEEVKESVDALQLEVGDIAEDKEAHRILSGISGQDELHNQKNEDLLRHIRSNTCQQTLAIEELKQNYRDLTYHIRKFEEDNIIQEAPDFEDSTVTSFKATIFNKNKFNGRVTDRTAPEKQQYPIVSEEFGDEQSSREYVFDEGMPFSIRMESYKGNSNGWHSLFPFEKKLGSDDKITVYNESVFPLQVMFRGGDEFIINEGISMELTKEEAVQLYIKRNYTISGFEVRYSIERMYTPEEDITINSDEEGFLLPEQTHARIGLRKVTRDKSYVYVAHGNEWKRTAVGEWQPCENKTPNSYSIDYFDAHTSDSYLFLNTIWGKRRVAITGWEEQSDRPTECYSEIWADGDFIYTQSAEEGKGWLRFAISNY